MKLLMTTDTVGGVWTYAVELARALTPAGVEVVLATMGAPLTDAQRRQVDALSNVVVVASAYKLEWMDDPWDDVRRSGDWLLDLAAQYRPDVVHLNGYAHGAYPFDAPVLVVGHSCVLSWWQAVKGEPAPAAAWTRYRQAVTAGLGAADLVAAPTRAMLDCLVRDYGPLPRARVIPNGRDPSLYRVGAKEPLVLTAGRLWDEAKNVAAIESVAPRLTWPVYVAGDATCPDGRGDTPRAGVVRLGRLDERALARWYARATIYVLPARYEPFGLSALEAALSGCALVLGDIPSLREVWDDAALYVPPGDHDAMAAALNRLMNNGADTARLAARARRRALAYAPSRMADAYLDAYRELLARHWQPTPAGRATDTGALPEPPRQPVPAVATAPAFATHTRG